MERPSSFAHPLVLSLGLGWIAGMRSTVAPTQASCDRQARSRRLWMLASCAEMLADKLPYAPDRTHPALLGGRVLSGALSSVYLHQARGVETRGSRLLGLGVAGAVGALASSYFCLGARRWVGRRFDLDDRLVGLAEDALVLALGAALFRGATRVRPMQAFPIEHGVDWDPRDIEMVA